MMTHNNPMILHPGDLAFTDKPIKIQTILGSCVSVTVWHPELKVGGMCHYLMTQNKAKQSEKNDYRYAQNALRQLLLLMNKHASPDHFIIGLFGGSKMFPRNCDGIGKENLAYAYQWLKDNKLTLTHKNTLGKVSRSLTLNVANGEIYLRCYEASYEEVPHEH